MNKHLKVNTIVMTGNIALLLLCLYLAVGHYTGWYEVGEFMYLFTAGLATYQGIVTVIDQSMRIYYKKAK